MKKPFLNFFLNNKKMRKNQVGKVDIFLETLHTCERQVVKKFFVLKVMLKIGGSSEDF